MAATATTSDSSYTVPFRPPPRSKSPPKYMDLYEKRRGMAQVQMLEREIGFLQEELKSVQGLQPSSRSCKEVTDFVIANPDPLLSTKQRNRSSCQFWKWLSGIPCFNFSCIYCCCYSSCSLHQQPPECCKANPRECFSCVNCTLSKCWCCSCRSCSCPRSHCFRRVSCSLSKCCSYGCTSCSDCYCCRGCCTCPKCLRVQLCSDCTKPCSYNCCMFF